MVTVEKYRRMREQATDRVGIGRHRVGLTADFRIAGCDIPRLFHLIMGPIRDQRSEFSGV